MQVVRTVGELRQQVRAWKQEGLRVGLVPTMGFLHEGHLSLVRLAREHSERVVMSIFVNPTQFGPGEDYDAYPRDEEGDCAKAASAGTDLVFIPSVTELYPLGAETFVECLHLPNHLCGLNRPGHFRGVSTVVAKLFIAGEPEVAVFGAKDYQQLQVIRRMARDLLIPVEIIAAPIIREPGGLAMSSRNKYLSSDERARASSIFQALNLGRELAEAGETSSRVLADRMAEVITRAGGRLDYLELFHPETLESCEEIQGPTHCAVAAHFGRARLIDNLRLVN